MNTKININYSKNKKKLLSDFPNSLDNLKNQIR